LERYFLEKDDTPQNAAEDDGFPQGWSKLIGGDEDHYDMYIDRYRKGLVTVWKDRGGFWWWGVDNTEPQQTMSKSEAIEAAERWLNKLE
jgi:hypothetical protein